MKNHLCIMLILMSTQILIAQWRDIRLTQIGPEDGLTMRVNAIVQDSTGYLYFGGSQGLCRYDGAAFRFFRNDPGDTTTIFAGEIYQMINDRQDRIWISHRYSGVSRFDPMTMEFTRYPLPVTAYEMEHSAQGLLEDDQGNIWIGGWNCRLYRWDDTTDSLVVFFPDWMDQSSISGRYAIVRILQDNQDPDQFWLSVLDYSDPRRKIDAAGWGLISFNRKDRTFTSHPNAGILDHQRDDGTLVFDRMVNFILEYDPEEDVMESITFRTTDYPKKYLARDLIRKEEDTWLMTAYEIQKITPGGDVQNIYVKQPDDPDFLGFFAGKDNLTWMVTEQGVRAYDPKMNQIQFFSLEQFNAPERIYPGRLAYDPASETILLAHHARISRDRLYRIPLGAETENPADFLVMKSPVYGVACDEKGRIWLTEGDGLYQLVEDKLVPPASPELKQARFPWHWNMRTSQHGYLGMTSFDRFMWFHPDSAFLRESGVADFPGFENMQGSRKEFMGCTFGKEKVAYVFSSRVFEIDLVSSDITWLEYDDSFNPTGDEIYDVKEDRDGFLWIGSPRFLGKFEKAENKLNLVRSYGARDGLLESQVTELHIDNSNRVWCYSLSGISCIDPRTDEIRTFSMKEGLPQAFIDPRQVITLPDHRLATVNKNGLITYHPDSLWDSKSTRSVKVVINEIRADGKAVQLDEGPNYLSSFSLPQGVSVVDIQFQGLAFPKADQLVYSYRLRGLQDEWISIGTNRFVTLSGISPGNYTFEVKAGVPDASSPVKSLRIKVPTPVFQQTWFILLVIGLVAFLIYLIYQFRLGQIRKEEAEKTRINKQIAELELKALRSQMNPHFMFNSLNSIKNFILRAEKTEAAEYLSNFAHLIRLILQNSRERQISLQDELETLMLYIELEQLRFDDSFEFNCEIGEGVRMEQTFIPPMILQPYVENAIWHGLMHKKEKGVLSISFERCDETYICCIIEDDGVGREKAMELKDKSIRKYKSMGMGITSDRIELMNQMDAFGISVEVIDLTIEKDGHAGTRVVVKVPVGVEQS